ncbi:MAG TPA: ABC transporter ATP-binding protein [Candidatus Dormibacteraeota bacterium]
MTRATSFATRRGRAAAALRLLGGALRNRRRDVVALAVWSLVQAIPAFLSGRLIELAVDRGFLQHQLLVGFGWLALLAASFVAGGIAAGRVFRSLGNVIEPMRDQLARVVVEGSIRRSARLGLPVDRAGVARLTEQVEIAREAGASVLQVTQGFIVATIGAVIGLLSLIPAALVLVVPPVVVGLAVFAAALPRMADRQLESILADERAAEGTAAVAAGLRDVVAAGAEDRATSLVERHIDAQAVATRQLARLTAVRTLAVAAGGLLPVILILLFGSWLRSYGATTGAILGALTYVLQGVEPALERLVRNLGSGGVWLVSALARVLEASAESELDSAEGTPERPVDLDAGGKRRAGSGRVRVRRRGSALAIHNLTFAYSATAAPVIHGLELTVDRGDHLAIVGPSGAGKSTLAGLIAGLLHPQAGSVQIGGVDAMAARHHGSVLRALIPQEAYVFPGTVLENVTYLDAGAPRAAVDHAIAVIGAAPLVERLGGCDAMIDPAALSAGERQLITLVRAYVSKAQLVILDEATCHLDPDAEARAELAFSHRSGAVIVIAHRISSALRARRVLLLDGGAAWAGTHDELLQASPLYRDLVGHWSGGAKTPRGRATPAALRRALSMLGL